MYNKGLDHLGSLNAKQLKDYEDKLMSGHTFVRATVVRTANSTAMNAGDKFWVTHTGELIGFSGGGCVRSALKKAAKKVIASRKASLIRSMPHDKINALLDEGDVDIYPSHCPSRGEVDIFLEPIMPKPLLLVLGDSEIAKSVTILAGAAGFHVETIYQASSGADFIVIATQGTGDKVALVDAISSKCSNILFVASQKKAQNLRQNLTDQTRENLTRIISPAGLNIHAKGPTEIAISIVAQLIQLRRQGEVNSQ